MLSSNGDLLGTEAISDQLVAFLRQQFPDRTPSIDWHEREIWFRAGQVSVWKFLQLEQERIREEQLRGL